MPSLTRHKMNILSPQKYFSNSENHCVKYARRERLISIHAFEKKPSQHVYSIWACLYMSYGLAMCSLLFGGSNGILIERKISPERLVQMFEMPMFDEFVI